MLIRLLTHALTVLLVLPLGSCAKHPAKAPPLANSLSPGSASEAFQVLGGTPKIASMEFQYENEEVHWTLAFERGFRFGNPFPTQAYWRLTDLKTGAPIVNWLEVPASDLEAGQISSTRGAVLSRILPKLMDGRLELNFDGSGTPVANYSLRDFCIQPGSAVSNLTKPEQGCLVSFEELPARVGDPARGRQHKFALYHSRATNVEVCVTLRTGPSPRCGTGPADAIPTRVRELAEGPIAVDPDDTYPGMLIGTYAGTLYNAARPMGFKLPIFVVKEAENAPTKSRIQISSPILEDMPATEDPSAACGPEYLLTVEGGLFPGQPAGRLPMSITYAYRFPRYCQSVLGLLHQCASQARACTATETRIMRSRLQTAIDLGVLSVSEIPKLTSVSIRSIFK